VVHIFLVDVNAQEMQPLSRTFVRQRSVEEGGTSRLKFLIHLHLATDARSQAHIFGDIRMLLSNRGEELDGLERLCKKNAARGGLLVMQTKMPSCSPIL